MPVKHGKKQCKKDTAIWAVIGTVCGLVVLACCTFVIRYCYKHRETICAKRSQSNSTPVPMPRPRRMVPLFDVAGRIIGYKEEYD